MAMQQMQRDRDRNRDRGRGRDAEGEEDEFPLTERVVRISRVAKVVKGGRHLSFNAVVVVGDMDGHVGIGMGKADAVPDAVRKGATAARKNIIEVPRQGSTIPHEVLSKYIGSIVMLKPAQPGTGVIAGASVRAVVELAGIQDIMTKVRRSTNPVNVVKATFNGLQQLKDLSRSSPIAEIYTSMAGSVNVSVQSDRGRGKLDGLPSKPRPPRDRPLQQLRHRPYLLRPPRPLLLRQRHNFSESRFSWPTNYR